jgi:MFS family permease
MPSDVPLTLRTAMAAHYCPGQRGGGSSQSPAAARSSSRSTAPSRSRPSRPCARRFRRSSPAGLSWILNAYTIVYAALLIPFGRLADSVGARSVFIWGLILFGLASLACGLAPTSGSADRGAGRSGRSAERC